MIVIAGTVRIRPEAREDAIRAAATMAQATRREPGCNRYHFAFDVEDPNLVHIIEEWASAEALAAHFQSAHMAAFQQAMPGVVAVVVASHVIAPIDTLDAEKFREPQIAASGSLSSVMRRIGI